jgi:hypothetical protein
MSALRAALQNLDLAPKLVWKPDVVGVEKRDVAPPGLADAGVA